MTEERTVVSNSLVFAGPYFGDLETEITRWVPYIRWLRNHYNGKHLAVAGYPGFHALYRGIANEYWNLPGWFVSGTHVPSGFDANIGPDIYLKLVEHFRATYDGKFAEKVEVRPPRGSSGSIPANQMLFDKLKSSTEADTLCRELLRNRGDKPCVAVLAETGKYQWPKSNWNQLLGMLYAKYNDKVTFVVGGDNVHSPEYAIDIEGFDQLARMDMTMAFLNNAICSFSTQGGLASLSLHAGCPSFIYGHESERWGDADNPLNTPTIFFETTENGYKDSPDGDLFQDACVMIEDCLDEYRKKETQRVFNDQHLGILADHTPDSISTKDPEPALFDIYQEPAGQTKEKRVGMVGVFDVEGSTNIPFAKALEKAWCEVRRINYRTEFQTVGVVATCERIVELSKRVDLMIFCKGNGIPPETVRECSKNTTTCWYMMDAWTHLLGNPDYLEFANACDFTVVTSGAMKDSLERTGVTKPIHHILQGVDPEEFHPVDGIAKKYDVGFIGQSTEKRDAILKAILKAGFSVTANGPGYRDCTLQTTADEFNLICAGCRVMIAINNTDPEYDSFSDRISRYFAAGACVLAEGTLLIDKYFGAELPVFTSPEHAVEAVKILINDCTAKDRSEFGKVGRQRVLDNYTWDHVASEICDIHDRVSTIRPGICYACTKCEIEDQCYICAHSECLHECDFEKSVGFEQRKRVCYEFVDSKPVANDLVANETNFATKDRLQIGFVSQWFERGQAYVTQMLRNTLVADHEVHILARNTVNDPNQLTFSNAAEFDITNVTHCGTYVINPEGFRKWVEGSHLNVVFFNEEPQIELVQIAKQCGAKTIGYFVWELFDPRNVELVRDHYDVVIAPTQAALKRFKELGIDNAVHVRWGVDKAFSAHQKTPRVQTDTLFFHPAGWGGLHGRRGTQSVIDAFLLAGMGDDAKLLVHTQQGTGEEVHGNITIKHGTVPRDEIIQMYHDADVVVLPSKWEGLGLTFLEVIAAGKPIITVDAPPMNEFVNAKTGILCRTGYPKKYDGIFVDGYDVDVQDLAASMKTLVSPSVRKDMMQYIDEVAERHSFEQFSVQIGNIVAKLHGKIPVQQTVEEPETVEHPMVLPDPPAPAITVTEKTRIFWTSEHCCIRVIKLALALMKTGRYEIHHAAAQPSWGAWLFDKFSMYHDRKQLENLLRDCPADLYIHSNEPNWQLNRIRKMQPDAKIILDAHDMDSIRQGLIPLDEHRAMTNCNAILFPSTQCRDYVIDLHRDQARNKPTAVIEHYCNEDFVNDTAHDLPIDQRKGLVYEGGALSPPYNNPMFKYRQLYHIFRQIVEQGNEVHLIFGNRDATAGYNNMGAFVHNPMEYDKLMLDLRKHKWGMVVFNNGDKSQHQVNWTRTNKEQEYLTAGLPLIVFGADATAEYVRENDIGLVFDRVEDIVPAVLDREYARVKTNVDRLRPTLTMEKHIHRLEGLIDKIL